MKTGKTTKKKQPKETIQTTRSAYGEKVPICTNVKCVLRKQAKCYGFEGCPGFKGK